MSCCKDGKCGLNSYAKKMLKNYNEQIMAYADAKRKLNLGGRDWIVQIPSKIQY